MGYNLLVVLGHKLAPNNKMHEILVKRLNKAVVFYRDYSINNIIVSGGIVGNKTTCSEAYMMKKYLIENGVPKHVIYTEK